MKYKIVQTIDDKFVVTELTDENVHAALEIRGFEFMGVQGAGHWRRELNGEPIFAGLCGPMWDGDCVRYEDKETNNRMSI
jgi:hypothetical protein